MRLLPFIWFSLLFINTAFAGEITCYSSDGDRARVAPGEDCPQSNPYTAEEYANRQSQGRQGRGQNGSDNGGSRTANKCSTDLKKARNAYADAYDAHDLALKSNSPDVAAKNTAKQLALRALNDLTECRALELVAQSLKRGIDEGGEKKRTMDGRATCQLKAGYTTDFDSCKSTATAYDTIMQMEQLLLTTQSLRNTQNEQNIQAQATAQAAMGDGQNAVYDATIANSNFKKNLGKEQLMAYTAAIGFLGSKIASWKSGKCGDSPTGAPIVVAGEVRGQPAGQAALTPGQLESKKLPAPGSCSEAIGTAKSYRGSEVVANDDAKAAFSQALIGFLAKAAQAKALMDSMSRTTAAVAAAKDQTANPDGGVVFEKCVVTPLDPECVERSGRQAAVGFSQGDFSAGEGFGNNTFDLGPGTADTPTDATTAPGDKNGAVAGVASPFGKAAKDANDILDPAAAAQTSPGGGAGGGGGGVGGGLGGGGGASLGNDLAGEDKNNKAKDIEANKLAGNYSSSGGKGFSAVAGGKEDNPFKSLFDSKSEGGIEEDRSIASEDGGKDSGLFQRISSRMSQVVAEKRIEANNLE